MEPIMKQFGYGEWLVVIDGEAHHIAGYEHEIWQTLMDEMGYVFYQTSIQVYTL